MYPDVHHFSLVVMPLVSLIRDQAAKTKAWNIECGMTFHKSEMDVAEIQGELQSFETLCVYIIYDNKESSNLYSENE